MSPSPSSRVGCRGARGEGGWGRFHKGALAPAKSNPVRPHTPAVLLPTAPAAAAVPGGCWLLPESTRDGAGERAPRQRGEGPVPGTPRHCLCTSGGVLGAMSIPHPVRAASIPCRGSAAARTPAACPAAAGGCCARAAGRQQSLVPVGPWEAWRLHPAHRTADLGC